MSFAEQRGALAAQLAHLEDLLRQAQGISRGLEERAEALQGQTDTFADDAALAQVSGVAKRARQDLGTLIRTVAGARVHVEQ